MGIKFHCPNGHKLNVKAFLAGKKGVCPKCGTKVRIPAVSEPGLDSDLDEGEHASAHGGNGSAAGAAMQPAAAMAAAVHTPMALPAAAPDAPVIASPAANDPIAEAPLAVWYVRPPTGGQYGPARGEVMRKWISEGRVSSDSLVWREGWTDWKNAGNLFPQLHAAGAAAAAAATPAISTGVTAVKPVTNRVTARQPTTARGNHSKAIALVVGLAIVCVVLIAVFVYVMVYVNKSAA